MSSRSFASQYILPDKEPFPVLFPVIDIANHSGAAKVKWQPAEPDEFCVTVTEGNTNPLRMVVLPFR
jgi:hypothetical protein